MDDLSKLLDSYKTRKQQDLGIQKSDSESAEAYSKRLNELSKKAIHDVIYPAVESFVQKLVQAGHDCDLRKPSRDDDDVVFSLRLQDSRLETHSVIQFCRMFMSSDTTAILVRQSLGTVTKYQENSSTTLGTIDLDQWTPKDVSKFMTTFVKNVIEAS